MADSPNPKVAEKADSDGEDDGFFQQIYAAPFTPGGGTGRREEGGKREEERKVREGERDEGKGRERGGSGDRRHEEERGEGEAADGIPLDFVSKYSKVWDAKAKATEMRWKRRREEELTCKLCGEAGHPTQGCPTTLGSGKSKKPEGGLRLIALKDKRLKPRLIGVGGATIQGLEKESKCRIQLEDNLAAGDGSFTVRISAADEGKAEKGERLVREHVAKVEEEFKQRRGAGGAGGGFHPPGPQGRPGGQSGVAPAVSMQFGSSSFPHAPVPMPNYALPPGQLGPQASGSETDAVQAIAAQLEMRRQWEQQQQQVQPVSGASSYSSALSGGGGYSAYGAQEAAERAASGNAYAAAMTGGGGGGGGGGGALNRMHGGEYGVSPADVTTGGGPAGSVAANGRSTAGGAAGGAAFGTAGRNSLPATQEELEQQLQQEALDLTKEQTAEEEAEMTRHRERMKEIQATFENRMGALKEQQAQRREAFIAFQHQLYAQQQQQLQQQQQQQAEYNQYPQHVGYQQQQPQQSQRYASQALSFSAYNDNYSSYQQTATGYQQTATAYQQTATAASGAAADFPSQDYTSGFGSSSYGGGYGADTYPNSHASVNTPHANNSAPGYGQPAANSGMQQYSSAGYPQQAAAPAAAVGAGYGVEGTVAFYNNQQTSGSSGYYGGHAAYQGQ